MSSLSDHTNSEVRGGIKLALVSVALIAGLALVGLASTL